MVEDRKTMDWGVRMVALICVGLLWAGTVGAQEPAGDDDGATEPAQEQGQTEGPGPVDGPEVPEDEWIDDDEDEEPTEIDGPRLPSADLEAPDDADPEFEAQLERYRDAFERYSQNIEEYQETIQNLVETEFDRRMAEIDDAYSPRIRAARAVESDQRAQAIASLETFLEQYPDDAAHTPDALFRIALLYDQREDERYAEALDAYNEEMDALDEQEDVALEDYPETPQRSYDESRATFHRLVDNWPDYRGIDLAYYFLAHIEWEQGNWEQSRELAARLIRERPDSQFIPHAWLMIGEFYFEDAERDGPEHIRENLELALEAFEQAGSEEGRTSMTDANYVRAIYSWAWTHYRLENYPEAIGVFRNVVEEIDRLQEETGQRRTVLREDALSHLAEILAMEDWDLDGMAVVDDTVMTRIEEYMNEGDDYEREVVALVGQELFEYLRFHEAIEVYEYVLAMDPLDPNNPKIHGQIVAALHRDYQDEEAFAVRRQMIDYYGEGSAWHDHQQRVGNEVALREAEDMVRDYLLMAATWYHEQAQTTRNEAMVSRDAALLALTEEQYALAADAYREFLQNYPNDREVFQWNFYYAETLYYAAEYADAFEQYQVVRELDIPDNPFQEVSAFNAIQALEFMMREDIERGELTPQALSGGDYDEARDAAEGMEQERQLDDDEAVAQIDVDGQPIPEIVMDYITTMDRYVVLGLDNPEDEYLGAKFAFQAAKVFHDFRHFDESRRRFAWVVDQYPEHEVAYLAGSLILESFRQENDFEGMTEWAEKLEGVIRGEQAEAVRAEVREYRLLAMFRAAEESLREEKYEESAAQFGRLAREAPEHRLAARALNNSASVYEIMADYDRAIEQYEELFRQFPDDDLSGRAVYRVAVNSEWLFDYDKSVRHYRLFYDQFQGPTPEALEELNFDIENNREEALLQAAQMNEYLQRYDEAAQTFEEFFDTYPESEFSADTLWAAARAWEKAGNDSQMQRVYDQYIDEFGDQLEHARRVTQIRQKRAAIYESEGRRAQADEQYEMILEDYEEWFAEDVEPPPGASSIRAAAAESRFMLIERDFEEWDEITIEGSLAQQERRLERKLEGVEELQDAYREVLGYQNLDWNLAAYFRIANLLHRMSDALYAVPNPFDEGTDEYWVYQDTLDDIAFPLEDAAIDRYEEVIRRARDNEIVNEWTERTLQALHDYQPANYPFFEEEKRPVQQGLGLGVPLMSHQMYEARKKRDDFRDQQDLETIETDQDDVGDEDGEEGS